MTLATALEHARARDWDACLSATIAAWRQNRHPALADLVDRICVRAVALPASEKEIRRRTEKPEAETDTELGRLIRFASSGWLVGALELYRRRPPDPRLTRLVVSMFEKYRNTYGLLDELEQLDDAREYPRILDLASRRYHNEDDARLTALAAAIAARQPPAAPDLATIAEIDAALTYQPRTDALAAIYANPEDTDARLVWADALLQQGDPRGEFIALQCRSPGSERERALLKMHGVAWLGSLAGSLVDGAHFRRGFPARGRFSIHRLREVPTDPAWQTFEDLDVGFTWGEALVPFLASLRALHTVRGLRGNYIAELARPAWTTLGLRDLEPSQLAALDLPALRELDFGEASLATVVHALAHYGRKIERIRVEVPIGTVPPLADLRAHARSVELVAGRGSVIVDDAGARIAGRPGDRVQRLLATIEEILPASTARPGS